MKPFTHFVAHLFVIAALLPISASAQVPKLSAVISGTIEVPETTGVDATRNRRSTLNNARVFAEFGV